MKDNFGPEGLHLPLKSTVIANVSDARFNRIVDMGHLKEIGRGCWLKRISQYNCAALMQP
jgi:hypothetical protein